MKTLEMLTREATTKIDFDETERKVKLVEGHFSEIADLCMEIFSGDTARDVMATVSCLSKCLDEYEDKWKDLTRDYERLLAYNNVLRDYVREMNEKLRSV